jgi:hypothetical protein
MNLRICERDIAVSETLVLNRFYPDVVLSSLKVAREIIPRIRHPGRWTDYRFRPPALVRSRFSQRLHPVRTRGATDDEATNTTKI